MKVEEIRKLIYAEPFRPFYIHIADGGRLLVKHPDYIALSPVGRSFMVYTGEKPGDFEIVDTAVVTRLKGAKSASNSR